MKTTFTNTIILIFALFVSVNAFRAQCVTTVPYYEDFQSITQTNELPACWSSSNPSVTCLTFTAGNDYAAFFHNPVGQSTFYSIGIQLDASITYSASVWYKTDFNLSANWSSFEILYGTSPSPSGLVSVASVPSPVLSQFYVNLSNTFTVPSSGVYYFAIRATSSSMGASQYLQWDDFSITIPCTSVFNPVPAPIVSQNSATICEGQQTIFDASVGSGPFTYSWNNGPTSATTSISPTVSMNYSVKVTNTITGCPATYTYYVHLNPAPQPFIVANKMIDCPGKNVVLTSYGAGATFSWSTGSINSVITVNPLNHTSYSVTATNSFNCSKTVVHTQSVLPVPILTVTPGSTLICKGEILTMAASGGTQFVWTPPGIVAPSVNVSPTVTSSYTLEGTDSNGCTKTETITIGVEECAGLKHIGLKETTKIFPNPSSGTFFIQINTSSQIEFEIYDVDAKLIKTGILNLPTNEISLANYPTGLYFLNLKSENEQRRIVLLRD